MSEYKFNCSGCGQHILANEKWVGRKINCPSCKTRITVPPPAKEAKKAKPAVPRGSTRKADRPNLPGGPMKAEGVSKEAGAASAPAPAPSGPAKTGGAAKAPKSKGDKTNKPLMPPGAPVQGAHPKLPTGLAPADVPVKKGGRSVTGQGPGSAPGGEEGKAAWPGAAKEATRTRPVMPPDQRAGTRQPGSSSTGEAGAKQAVTATGSAPALEAKGAEEGVAKASAAKGPKEELAPPVAAKSGAPKEPKGRMRIELPVQVPDAESTPVGPGASSGDEGQGAAGAESASGTGAEVPATEGEQPRVAVLSPAVKLELVRAVRRRIADEAAWLPGRVEGATAYAGKMEGGELVLVEAKSPDATRFSLIGAFLKEMDVRRVVRTATGRRRLLDEEIPEAIREVLLEGVSDEEREGAEDRLSGEELESISHAQCLAVFDALEGRYMRREEQVQVEKAKRRLGNVRLPELVKKLQQKARISPEEVATALYHELMEVCRRLDRLESGSSRPK